ncbi:MAG: hypothetical protein ACRDJ4_08415 [Actinomycetota bacterium]
MSEGHPSTNGHRKPRRFVDPTVAPSPPPEPRARWIVVLGVVSAATGLFLLAGASIGAVLGGAGRQTTSRLGPGLAILGLAVGGLAGVWLGAWAAARLAGTGMAAPRPVVVAMGLGGTAGLAFSVLLLGTLGRYVPGVVPLLAMLSPGVGALIGQRVQGRMGRRRAEHPLEPAEPAPKRTPKPGRQMPRD